MQILTYRIHTNILLPLLLPCIIDSISTLRGYVPTCWSVGLFDTAGLFHQVRGSLRLKYRFVEKMLGLLKKVDNKNRGSGEGDRDQKPRDAAAVIKNVRGEQHKIKTESGSGADHVPASTDISFKGWLS